MNNKIPKALQILKENSGENWPKLRSFFIKFCNLKREIAKVCKGNKPIYIYLNNLLKKDFLKKLDSMEFTQCKVWEFGLVFTYTSNVIKTLAKLDYSSVIMCYIQDSYNKMKSGNKKYPQYA